LIGNIKTVIIRDLYIIICTIKISPADALLVEAAPDLLAALEGLLDHYEDLVHSSGCGFWDSSTEDVVIKAQAAIAKAKGEKP